jgi:hypothetical protein
MKAGFSGLRLRKILRTTRKKGDQGWLLQVIEKEQFARTARYVARSLRERKEWNYKNTSGEWVEIPEQILEKWFEYTKAILKEFEIYFD